MMSHLSLSPSNTSTLAAKFVAFGLVISSLGIISLAPGPTFAQTVDQPYAAVSTPISIEATEFLEWDQTAGTYIAKGKAIVQQDESSIKAEHIVARYTTGGETRNINRVIATGTVTYVEGENTAKGHKLDYDLTTSFYKLTGKKASVEGPQGKMTATKSITYDTTDNSNRKVTATGGASYKNIDGRTVFGDKLIAVIGADGILKTLNAYDNTKVITAKGTEATADRLNYAASTSLAHLDGNVEIIDKENVMRGDKAKIDFDREISRIISRPGGMRVSGTLVP